ncbi:double-strand break repair helicase AddA [Marinicauda pacifica]|uniref:DNA 3'-5' helicase n=1 Tax=Marinicauda pacifica TaxID=1133559 RepID=A0A4S2HCF2_9PROT|nr:double-strand break repair helicase AddA [Marinicauda pacifica]TGY93321.1 double-strand break repair helicase AddA [Marinicauda pacifica]GGE44756.1 double-strand break repair helicase AddA [Marinicauda pacifica]
MSAPGFDPAIVKSASDAQRAAAAPDICVFVEANAGSGKTRVLVDRVARLLLKGAEPERILCVTFTKAAAGEMQTRLFKKLGEWSTLSDPALSAELESLEPAMAGDRDRLARARRLFARALETPGGLKIQTLHAYCERLLRQFPLEAGLPPGFETQDESEARALQRACLTRLYARASADPGGEIARAIATLLDLAGPSGPETLAGFVTAKRHRFGQALAQAGSPEALMDRVSAALGVPPSLSEAAAKADGWMETDPGDLEAAQSAYSAATSTQDIERGDRLAVALAAALLHPVHGFDAYCDFLLTGKGEFRKSFFTKKLGETYTILRTLYGEEGSEIHRMRDEVLPRVRAASTNTLSRAAIRLGAALLEDYEAQLVQRRKVDFSDLVVRARGLLTDSDARDWTLYKLDRGLQHILVDEAQDTAPDQWAVVDALSEEFFAGEGDTSDTVVRTVFCVGDEKQSIYSFQDADPRLFIAQGVRLHAQAEAAGIGFARPPLDVSFRSSPEVLRAVDLAFSAEEAALGVPTGQAGGSLEVKFLMSAPETARERQPIAFHAYAGHRAARVGTPGCVEIWPPVPKPAQPEEESIDLTPVDTGRTDSARNQLAEAVAREIEAILGRGDRVWQEGSDGWQPRAAEPGDILILVRKRSGLFDEIIRRLKLKDLPVAGADRMTLTDQLAVEDMVSLARFALLPEDDLSLAEILKSPAFHPIGAAPVIDDDALFDLSRRPERRLWDKMRNSDDPRFLEARDALDRARARVDRDAPYAFFATFLGEVSSTGESRVSRFFARLGEEARDPLDELLNRALSHEREGAPSLTRFIASLDADSAQIKREMEGAGSQIRVMTVHGAKGLEAPIVFLPDTTQIPKARGASLFVHDEAGLVWAPDAKNAPELVSELQEEDELSADGEYTRLLYVALTRARDRLVVCGHTHGIGGKIDPGSWLDRLAHAWTGPGWEEVRTAIHDIAEDYEWEAPPARRLGDAPPPMKRDRSGETLPAPLPAWTSAQAPEEPQAPRSVAPSRLVEEDGEDFAPASLSPLSPGGEARFRRGAVIHKLLQTLPDIEPDRRQESARRYLQSRQDLEPWQRDEILAETLGVLSDSRFAPIFGPGSRAEVAITGSAPGLPPGVTVNGQIDRLVVTERDVLIIDYKTNRPPPAQPEDVAPVYLGQMAAYRALLKALHPGKPVHCALLWTDGPRLMALPDALLDDALTRSSRRPDA